MTPLERAARAIDDLLGIDGQLCATPTEVARAVITAISEPSEGMVHAGSRGGDWPHSKESWHAMIDALLAEGENA